MFVVFREGNRDRGRRTDWYRDKEKQRRKAMRHADGHNSLRKVRQRE